MSNKCFSYTPGFQPTFSPFYQYNLGKKLQDNITYLQKKKLKSNLKLIVTNIFLTHTDF